MNLIFEAQIEDKWHLYSQYMDFGGPMPLYFSFEELDNYQIIDSVTESPEPHAEYDDVYEMEVKSFTKSRNNFV